MPYCCAWLLHTLLHFAAVLLGNIIAAYLSTECSSYTVVKYGIQFDDCQARDVKCILSSMVMCSRDCMAAMQLK